MTAKAFPDLHFSTFVPNEEEEVEEGKEGKEGRKGVAEETRAVAPRVDASRDANP